MEINELRKLAKSIDPSTMGHFPIPDTTKDGSKFDVPSKVGDFDMFHDYGNLVFANGVAWHEGEEVVLEDGLLTAYRPRGYGKPLLIQAGSTVACFRFNHRQWYCLTTGGPPEPKSSFFNHGKDTFLKRHLPCLDEHLHRIEWERSLHPIAPKNLGRLFDLVAFLKSGQIMVEGDLLPDEGDIDLGSVGFSIARYSGTKDVFFYSKTLDPIGFPFEERHKWGVPLTFQDGQWFQVLWKPIRPPSLLEAILILLLMPLVGCVVLVRSLFHSH